MYADFRKDDAKDPVEQSLADLDQALQESAIAEGYSFIDWLAMTTTERRTQ